MYREIVVPLDGSELAEAALPHARDLAKESKAHMTLLAIVKPVRHMPYWPSGPYGEMPVTADVELEVEEVVEEDERAEVADAEKYLGGVASWLKEQGVDVDIAVVMGEDAATCICEYVDKLKDALIVISTHGRSGIRRWVYGSVTARVLRGVKSPVLVVRSKI